MRLGFHSNMIIGSIGHFGWKCKIVILDQSQIIGAIILKYNGTIEPIYGPAYTETLRGTDD